MGERKPLDAQFVGKTNQAAMRALADATARRKWADSVSGSPVTTNMLCAEIARLNLEREQLRARVIEECAAVTPPTSETYSYQACGFASGWSQCREAFRKAILGLAGAQS